MSAAEMQPPPTFLGLPIRLAPGQSAKAAIFGAGHGSTYPGEDSTGHAGAPDAIRAASMEDADFIENWDFDLGGPLFDGKGVCCIDRGNLATALFDNAANRLLIESTTRDILMAGAAPVLLGGDCSVTAPFLAGFAEHSPIWVLQIDAHIDWRDERFGERYGYSSPMRRASEMPHVAGMVQAGLRSVGSARASDVGDALNYGSRFVSARDIHAEGAEAVFHHLPDGAQIVIALDCDSLDPGIMPGVAARTPGGLTYMQVIDLIAGVSRSGRIAGFVLTELYTPADTTGLSALLAARIVVNVVGAIARQS